MLNVRLEPSFDKALINPNEIPKSLARVAIALARLTAEQTGESMDLWYDIRDAYVKKGMRHTLTASNGNLAEAVAYHKDRFLKKQEGSTVEGKIAIPTPAARKEHPKLPTRRVKDLEPLPDYYSDETGLWERAGNNRHKLWYIWAERAQYSKRMDIVSIAKRIIDSDTVELQNLRSGF